MFSAIVGVAGSFAHVQCFNDGSCKMNTQICTCGAQRPLYKCPMCISNTPVTILSTIGGSQLLNPGPFCPSLLPPTLTHPLTISCGYVQQPASETTHQDTKTSEKCIRDSLTFLHVCEQFVESVLDEALPDLLRETLSTCFEDVISSYLRVEDVRSESAFSSARSTGPAMESTSPEKTVNPMQTVGDVSGWVCGQLLDKCVFEALLEASLTGGTNLVATAISNDILQEMMFEELLKIAMTHCFM